MFIRVMIVQRSVSIHDQEDEVKLYLDARYVSASEACWRILGFRLHDEKPDIQRLQVHLPNQQNVTFVEGDKFG